MRNTHQIQTGGANARPVSAIRVTQRASGRDTSLDVPSDEIRGIEDLRAPGYVGAPSAIHVAGRTEPFRVAETRAEIYSLLDAAGRGYRIGALQA